MKELSLWELDAREALGTLINRYQNSGAFAVFDADNTLWKGDITESLLVWLENRDLLTLDSFPETMLPVPPLPSETVYGYYHRLCEGWHEVGYLWSAQAFQGFSLAVLHREMVAMLQSSQPLQSQFYREGVLQTVEIPIPKVFAAQVQLIQAMRSNGISVWVVSASIEELVRMFVSDPALGIGLAPENVIGVNMLLRFANGETYPSARDRESGLKGLDDYFSEERMKAVVTHHLYTPASWFQGKVMAIQKWIDPVQRPILAAGDSPNDFFMQFYVNAIEGGVRMRIHRKESHRIQLKQEIEDRISGRSAVFDPTLGWLEVSF